MIGRLRGEVIDRVGNALTVDVGGVGYVVTVARADSFAVADRVDLHVHTHVREDALQLFGFADALEREVFHLLLSVPQVGPAKAMGILATPALELVGLVAARDAGRLARIPGVGKKTAERMLVDLPDKFALLSSRSGVASFSPRANDTPASGALADLTSALVNLGFKPPAAEHAARDTIGRLGEGATLESLVKAALSHVMR